MDTRGFNPCCSGSASSARRRQREIAPGGVSIPVVLDLPHRPRKEQIKMNEQESFNPCCSGSASSASSVISCRGLQLHRFNPCCSGSASSAPGSEHHHPDCLQVSIPVVLDLPHRPDRTIAQALADGMFQSLLFWICLIGLTATAAWNRGLPGFNPCCSGSASSASLNTYVTVVSTWFQSLLFWICLIGGSKVLGVGEVN